MFHHEAMFQNADRLPEIFNYKDLLELAAFSVPGISGPGKFYSCMRFIQIHCHDDSGEHGAFYTSRAPRRYERLAELKKCRFFLTAQARTVVEQIRNTDEKQLMGRLYSFFSDRLEATNPVYQWHFNIRNPPLWLHDAHIRGSTLTDTSKLLAVATNQLRLALDLALEDLSLEAVSVIMDWGRAYYPSVKKRGNQATVEKLHEIKILASLTRENFQILKTGDYKDISHTSVGWTRVWACLLPDSVVMLDGRVSYALGGLLKSFSEESGLDLRFLCERTGFYQLSLRGRTVDGIPKMDKCTDLWALSLRNTSRFLLGLLDFADRNNRRILHGYPFNLKGLEAKLSMMGE